jgi:hypothetical protein
MWRNKYSFPSSNIICFTFFIRLWHNYCLSLVIRGNKSLYCFAEVKYLGTTVTNTIYIQVKDRRELNSGNNCQHFLLKHLASYLVYKCEDTIMILSVLYSHKTWYTARREGYRFRVLKKIFLITREDKERVWGIFFVLRNFIIFIFHKYY